MLKLQDGTRKRYKLYLVTRTCIKLTNKLVISHSRALVVLGQATSDLELTRFTMPQIRGKPPPSHLPPYSILCIFPRHLHPNGFLSQDSQGGVPKLSRFRFPRLCEIITLCSKLWLKWGLKQTCNSPWELSNGVLHSTCTHQGRVNSQLLVAGSQTARLTSGLSFCHNLCCRFQMAHASPFSTSTFRYLSNDIKNTPMWGVVTLAIELWNFRSSKSKSPFRECECHPHTLPKVGLQHWTNKEHVLLILYLPQVTASTKHLSIWHALSPTYYLKMCVATPKLG